MCYYLNLHFQGQIFNKIQKILNIKKIRDEYNPYTFLHRRDICRESRNTRNHKPATGLTLVNFTYSVF